MNRSKESTKIIDGHNYNESELFLKMGMLRP